MRRRFISEGLENYLNKEHEAWHMPGHKRKAQFSDETALSSVLNQVMAYDVTEVPGTDDLYLAEDFLKASLEQLKDIYQTAGSYYIVNGSTGGIFTAIAACTKAGDKIIMARNCHKSVYNAVEVLGLSPVYVEDAIFHKEEKLHALCDEHKDAAAVVLTSPTYEGVIADVEAICNMTKENHTYVIVDEAHGAHLPFMEKKLSAISQGADLVVQSTHKTLPAMTQTALLHVCNEALVERVERYWRMFLSSSPSYILMASTEQAVCLASEFDYKEYLKKIRAFRNRCKQELKHLALIERQDVIADGGYDYDESRLVIYGKLGENSDQYANGNSDERTDERLDERFEDIDTYWISGSAILEALEQYGNVVCEMAGENYVVLISSIADTQEDFDRLFGALCKVDQMIAEGLLETEVVDLEYSEAYLRSLIGTEARDAVYVYPPGSYILTCGEKITEKCVNKLINYQKSGLRLRGKL